LLFNLVQLCVIISLIVVISFIAAEFIFSSFSFYNYYKQVLALLAAFLLHDYFRKISLANSEVIKALVLDIAYVFSTATILAFTFYADISFSYFILLLALAYVPAIALGLFTTKLINVRVSDWTQYMREHLNHGKWLLMSATIQWWSSNLFVVMSGLYLGVEALGAFRLVQSLFGVINVFLQTFENYVLPNASRIYEVSAEQASSYLYNLNVKSILAFGTVLIGIFSFAELLLKISVGQDYVPYAFVVRGMVILYFIIIAAYPIRLGIRLLLLNKIYLIGYVFTLIFSLISFKFLLQQFELTGAIAGLIVSQLILAGFWYSRLIKNNFRIWKSFM
jgi:O-antigen/teichoic acid export membrane protein